MAKKQKNKKSAIVSGYLEKIGQDVFDEYGREAITRITKGQQGLYALYDEDDLYYVGLAKDLKGRINNHLSDRHKGYWTRFSLYVISHHDHIKELESLLLRIAYPGGNKQKGNLRQSRNLKPELNRLMDVAWREKKKRTLGKGGGVGRRNINPQLVAWQTMKGERPAKGLFNKGTRLLASYKGKVHKAWLHRTGRVRFSGRLYESPSAAGAAARGGQATNGWWFWKVKNGKGELVRLREFRK